MNSRRWQSRYSVNQDYDQNLHPLIVHVCVSVAPEAGGSQEHTLTIPIVVLNKLIVIPTTVPSEAHVTQLGSDILGSRICPVEMTFSASSNQVVWITL